MPLETRVPLKRGVPAEKTPLQSWWMENISEHAYSCNRAFAVQLREDRTDYVNWWKKHMPSDLAAARAEFITGDRRVSWFCTFTIGGKRPHQEQLRKAVSWFMRTQVHYANFAWDFSPQNAIEYSVHFERGECSCGEHRWHVHVLIFDNPRMTHGFLAKWAAWWGNLYGWCKIEPPKNADAAVRYCAGYAGKYGEFELRDTVQDNREWEENRAVAVDAYGRPFRRAAPCHRCGKVSECTCAHPDQLLMFSEASSTVPSRKVIRAVEDAHVNTIMRGDAAREGRRGLPAGSVPARSAGLYASRRRERFLRYRCRWREARQRHHEQVSPRG